MADNPTILFCVGATKAGTSWLYEHLAVHPDCHLRSIKELHYFSCVESGRYNFQLKKQRSRLDELAAKTALRGAAPVARLQSKRRDLEEWITILKERREDVAAYLRFLSAGRTGQRLVADITPEYALLPEARLRAMAGIAPDVRFLYLLRDPVDRLWSEVRMLARRSVGGIGVAEEASRMLDDILDGKPSGAIERSDYAGVLTRLRAAVAPERLLVLFQEQMMSLPGLARLCAFLGIGQTAAEFDRRVHAGPVAEMSEMQRQRARALLRPQYEYVSRRFPDLPERWRLNMDGVSA